MGRALGLGSLLASLPSAVAAAEGPGGAPGSGLSQRLFEAALPLANLSLHGRFINEMADGSLPPEVFRRYLAQDNLYLFKYARAFAALASKSDRSDEFSWLMNKSVAFLMEHGARANTSITEEDFEREALPVTAAYADLYLQAAWHEDAAVAYAAVLPCQRLYDWLFATLWATRPPAPGNPYRDFVRQYADPSNHRTTEQLEALLDRRAAGGLAPGLEARAREHYRAAMAYEAQFFEQAFGEGSGREQVRQDDLQTQLALTAVWDDVQSGASYTTRSPAAAAMVLGGALVLLLALRAAVPWHSEGSTSARLLG